MMLLPQDRDDMLEAEARNWGRSSRHLGTEDCASLVIGMVQSGGASHLGGSSHVSEMQFDDCVGLKGRFFYHVDTTSLSKPFAGVDDMVRVRGRF